MKIPILSDILDALNKGWTWVKNTAGYWWGVLLGLIVVPINWLCDRVIDCQNWLGGKLDSLTSMVQDEIAKLGIGALWGAAGPYLAKANAIVPIDFAVSCLLLCMVVWVVCTIIRVVIHFIPIPTAG
jgi:hypothetical protein